ARSEAVLWVLLNGGRGDGAPYSVTDWLAGAANAATLQMSFDSHAKSAAQPWWSEDWTRSYLKQLASASVAFADKSVSVTVHARRAERLVLALDRLTLALPAAKTDAVNTALNQLFADAQSVPDFDP